MINLYRPVTVKKQCFKNVKRVTVPNQSLSLREIVRRFVRREAVPAYKEGVYETRFGDLEKMAKLDMTEQYEIVEDMRAKIAAFEKRTAAPVQDTGLPPSPPTPTTTTAIVP